ncbi:hypothetical protein ACMFMG_008337 [Clarireedia jacksonii]
MAQCQLFIDGSCSITLVNHLTNDWKLIEYSLSSGYWDDYAEPPSKIKSGGSFQMITRANFGLLGSSGWVKYSVDPTDEGIYLYVRFSSPLMWTNQATASIIHGSLPVEIDQQGPRLSGPCSAIFTVSQTKEKYIVYTDILY